MKKLLWLVLCLVVAYPLYPFLVGLSVESSINRRLDSMVEDTPYLKIVDRKFHRGWYQSQQDLTIELGGSLLAAAAKAQQSAGSDASATPDLKAPRLTLHNIIQHGPLPGFTGIGLARIDTHIEYSPEARAGLAKVFGSKEPVAIRSYLGLLGGASTHVQSPALQDVPVGDKGERLSWDGLDLKIDSSRNANHVSVRGGAPGLVVTDTGGGKFTLKGLSADIDLHRILRRLYGGKGELRIASIDTSGMGETGNMKDLVYGADTRSSGDFTDMSLRLKIGSIVNSKGTIDDLRYEFTLAHLHSATLAQMQDSLTADYRQMAGDASADPSLVAGRVLNDFRTYGLELLQHDPELHIDHVGMHMPAGSLSLEGKLLTKGISDKDFGAGSSMLGLLNKLNGDFNVSIGEKLLAELGARGRPGAASAADDGTPAPPSPAAMASQRVDEMVANGVITRRNGELLSHVTLVNGVLSANGKQLFPPAGLGDAR